MRILTAQAVHERNVCVMALRKKAATAAAAPEKTAAVQEAEKPAAKTRKAPARKAPAAKKAAAPQVELHLPYLGKDPVRPGGDSDPAAVHQARGPGHLLCGQRRGQRQGGAVSPSALQARQT